MASVDATGEDVTQDGPVLAIGNEFGLAWVRKIRTRNGERLEIRSPNLEYVIRLDALQLEALSWQQPEAISELMATPPEPTRHLPAT